MVEKAEIKTAPQDFTVMIDKGVYGHDGLLEYALSVDRWLKNDPSFPLFPPNDSKNILHLGPVLEDYTFRPAPRPSALLSAVRKEYAALPRVLKRFVLGGEEKFEERMEEDAQSLANKLTRDELIKYLEIARDQGRISYHGNIHNLAREIDPNENKIDLAATLAKKGVLFDAMRYRQEVENILYAGSLRPTLRDVAMHKLGALLDWTERVERDAKKQGTPVPPDYKPHDPSSSEALGPILNRFNLAYQREELPTFGEVLEEARSIFTKHADPRDPLLAHRFVTTA
ncbi:MAG TPA: hypothetical protein VLF68_00140 [Candidatus Saccharimonadales bacterium]|nr:hypothetical protein [Candidatus Saccharimonadales bacterium]